MVGIQQGSTGGPGPGMGTEVNPSLAGGQTQTVDEGSGSVGRQPDSRGPSWQPSLFTVNDTHTHTHC